jgi:hypothetical protein
VCVYKMCIYDVYIMYMYVCTYSQNVLYVVCVCRHFLIAIWCLWYVYVLCGIPILLSGIWALANSNSKHAFLLVVTWK